MNMTYMPYCSDFLSDISQMKCPAVMVAMEEEESAMMDGVDFKERIIGNRTKCLVKELQLDRRTVLIGRSGIGLVNAGVMLTLLCEHYPVDAVMLLGVGGALDEGLKIGDTVIANQVLQHDSIASRDEKTLPIAP